MGTEFNTGIKQRIALNGKEYGSPEGPEQFRQNIKDALDQAKTSSESGGIVFNGGDYYDPEALPPGTRINYVETLRKSGMGTKSALFRQTRAGSESPLSARTVIILLLTAALALVWKLFRP